MSQVNVNKKKKRAVPITPQNELPSGQFSVTLFTYLPTKENTSLVVNFAGPCHMCANKKDIFICKAKTCKICFYFIWPSHCKN